MKEMDRNRKTRGARGERVIDKNSGEDGLKAMADNK
jgi:hypothetical protein